MNKKWKFATLIACIIMAVSCLAAFTACKKNVENRFVITAEETVTLSGIKGEDITFPDVPSRVGYKFEGWYTNADFSGSKVTSGKFDGKTVYYAHWDTVQTSSIILDADGGTLSETTIVVEEGQSVYEAVNSIVPVKGSLVFGGWFLNGEPLTEQVKAFGDSITLKARYKAKYIIKAKVMNLDGKTYSDEVLKTDYAYVGETVTPDYSMEGFTSSGAKAFTVGESESENTAEIVFDRSKYIYSVSKKYPDGTTSTGASKQVYYGTEIDVPSDTLDSPDGYRFLGWSDKENASYGDVLSGKYVITGETTFFPVWDKAYTDTFGGNDYLFIDRDKENSATLVRGTVSIKGTYDPDYGMYIFASEDPSFSLKIKLDEAKHRFIYYLLSGEKYNLYNAESEEGFDENAYIMFTKLDELEYHTEEGTKKGKYYIDSDIYVATFDDGTELRFLVGTVQGKTKTTKVYRVRGKEYEFGDITMSGDTRGLLTLVLDGFGYAVATTYNGNSQTYTYTISQVENQEVYYLTLTYNSSSLSLRLTENDGKYVYDIYTKDLDKTYNVISSTKAEQYDLDGCGKVDYIENGKVIKSGTYTATSSLIGGYIAKFKFDGEEITMRLFTHELLRVLCVEEVAAGYAEYYYCNDEGGGTEIKTVIAINGATAVVYEEDKKGAGTYHKVSEGSVDENDDGSYVYTTDAVSDDAILSSKTMTFNIDSSTGNALFYVLEADGSEVASKKEYLSEDGYKLTIVSIFGIYTNGTEAFKGSYKTSDNYSYITDGQTYRYFIIEGDIVYALSRQPIELSKIENGKTDYNTTLVVTGKKIGDDYEAIYSVVKKQNNQSVTENHKGSFTETKATILGGEYAVYVFTSSDGSDISFKFYISSRSVLGVTLSFFHYYDLNSDLEFGSLTKIDDDDSQNDRVKLIFTDRKSSDGKYIVLFVEYDEDGNVISSVEGTLDDGETVNAFKEQDSSYTATKYTFTPIDGSDGFGFTLLGSTYFRICSADATYTTPSGDKLELDGTMHVARYTAKGSKKPSYNAYIIVDGVIGENGKAVYTLVDGKAAIFDIDGKATVKRRGDEANVYYMVDNGSLTGKFVVLDGQGKATVYDSKVEENKGTEYPYEFVGDSVAIYMSDEDKTQLYIGNLSSQTQSDTTVYFFTLLKGGFSGAYINEKDLSVFVLDDVGNVVKYTSYGKKDTGSYIILDDGVIYYCNAAATDAGVYSLADGKVFASVLPSEYAYNESLVSATYYADDFSSIVFYNYGLVLYNNETQKFFTHDSASGKLTTYEKSDSGEANAYGYVVGVGDLGDVYAYEGKEYYIYDGLEVTLKDADGQELVFQPTGGATFTVSAKIMKDGNAVSDKYYVMIGYNTDETVPYVYLAERSKADAAGEKYYINGGTDNYMFTVNYDLELHFAPEVRSFAFDGAKFRSGITAYNYDYIAMLSRYGSSMSSLIAQIYGGVMGIVAETDGDVTKYSVWGTFNYISVNQRDENGELVTDAAGKVQKTTLSFVGGELSKAANYSDGHLYTVEFKLGTEEKFDKYHLTFRLYRPNAVSNEAYYVFKVISVSKVVKEISINGGNDIYYEEAYVYTSGQIKTGTKDESGNDEYYNGTTANGMFLPSVRYNGELLPVDKVVDENGYRKFYFGQMNDKKLSEKVLYFKPLLDDDGNVTGGDLTEYYKTTVKSTKTGVNEKTEAVIYTDGKNVAEVVSVAVPGYSAIDVASSTVNGDGTVTVTIEGSSHGNNGTYKLTFGYDDDGNIVSVDAVRA